MDIFDLAGSLVEQYEGFSRSFANIRADDITAQINAEYELKRFWPEPVLQINPEYKAGATVADLVARGRIHPGCADIFRGWTLRYHQEMAAEFGAEGRDFIVTTGTGSGKSLCFFIPIISDALSNRTAGKRKTRAIIVYPMNALANSQQEELAKYFRDQPEHLKVSYRRYTGQESQEERRDIADNPPDILLTNFVMLELLMTRQDEVDRKVLDNCVGLSTLVLDELHTYRGRQGADVAMLVRRIRRKLAPTGLQCIGTSATMSSDERPEEAVAAVASKLFDCKILPSRVITERLERRTNPKLHARTVRDRLATTISAPIDEHASNADLAAHPVAIWIETVLGVAAVEKNGVPDGTWIRAKPQSLSDAAKLLAADSGLAVTQCKDYLERFLLVLGRSEELRCGAGSDKAFLGVRLHQFISGAGQVYMTIQAEGERRVVFDGQKFLPDESGDKLLYQLRFCPQCGQEHLPVTRTMEGGVEKLVERDIDELSDAPADDGSEAGFFMPARSDLDFTGDVAEYPESWQETTKAGVVRLKSDYAKKQHRQLRVTPTGEVVSTGGTEGWFQPGRFRFCPACGEATTSRGTDRSRLAGLTAEGRGSASTIIVSAILNWMNRENSGVDRHNRKILGFIDNRQDAALQSGHFNDFVFVSLMRAATLMALQEAGDEGLEDDQLGRQLQKCLGFDSKHLDLRVEWLSNPELQGAALSDAERALRDVLVHRFWVDQLKIWRITNPNLARLGLMTVEYKGLDEIAASDARFEKAHSLLAGATPDVRKTAMTALLDHMRINLAIKTGSLEAAHVQALRDRSQSLLRAPWNLSEENSRQSAALFLNPPGKAVAARDEALRVRSGPTSALGRTLRSRKIWGHRLETSEYKEVLAGLLRALENEIIERSDTFAGETNPNWTVYPSAFVFKLGQGVTGSRGNAYFTELYQTLATMLQRRDPALFGLEAREHTAQVEQTTREVREARFRFRPTDQARLRDVPKFAAKLQELADTPTFLPVMFCSPTMELGVDIADLDTVFLRNVPGRIRTPRNARRAKGRGNGAADGTQPRWGHRLVSPGQRRPGRVWPRRGALPVGRRARPGLALAIPRLNSQLSAMRAEQEIFDELAALCVSPGYIHAFATLCFRDTIVSFAGEMKPDDMAKLFSPSVLIRTELTTLHGLMVRRPIDFSLPSPGTVSDYIEQSDRLMAEIHQAMMAPGEKVLMDNIGNPDFNPFTVAEALREAIFYSGQSAYSFQYRDLAPQKYATDEKWLRENRGFDMQSARDVVKALTDTLNVRLMTNLKELRGKPAEEWTMLPGFTFAGAELAAATKLPFELVSNVLSVFAGPSEGYNAGFTSLAAFNAAYAFPFVRMGTDEYLLFQQYGITEALYDAPFYWMGADKAYAPTAFEHRGAFTESFSHERLLAVFGAARVFKNVEILRGKGTTLGEIDVLVLFGDQAVVVQAKSKKLTLEARNGNDLRLQGDFQAAVQDAIVQAFDYAAFLGDPTVTLKCRDGTVVNVAKKPKTIYPVTVVSDHYPALAFQARQLIRYEATDQIVAPLVIDLFALDAITEMLETPLRLLSYLRLRALFGDAFLMSHEHTLLSYHLAKNLWQDGFDLMMVGDDISSGLDIAMTARRDDVPGAKTPPGILTAFADTPFSRIVAQIEGEAEPVAIGLGYLLLELGGDTIKTLNRNVTRVLELVAKDGKLHDMTMGIGKASSGLTIHGSDLLDVEANKRLYGHCRLRKYSQKATDWYGISLRPDGSIKLAAVLQGPWKFDPELEIALAEMPAPRAGYATQKTSKPGRNDACPCGSGKKYKKCHGV